MISHGHGCTANNISLTDLNFNTKNKHVEKKVPSLLNIVWKLHKNGGNNICKIK